MYQINIFFLLPRLTLNSISECTNCLTVPTKDRLACPNHTLFLDRKNIINLNSMYTHTHTHKHTNTHTHTYEITVNKVAIEWWCHQCQHWFPKTSLSLCICLPICTKLPGTWRLAAFLSSFMSQLQTKLMNNLTICPELLEVMTLSESETIWHRCTYNNTERNAEQCGITRQGGHGSFTL